MWQITARLLQWDCSGLRLYSRVGCSSMNVVDPGHVYDQWQLGSDEHQRITFVKRSGGAIQYDDEHPGVQVQEVLRVLIDRSKYLDDIIP